MRQKVGLRPLPEKIKGEIEALLVAPFVEVLTTLLANPPDAAALKKVGGRRPGEWALMVKTFAGLCGYTEKRETVHTGVLAHIHGMSDAQLREAAQTLLEGKPVIEGECTPAEPTHAPDA